MSDVKAEKDPEPGNAASTSVPTRHSEREIQREDLRLDCLRLAAQRQGARDSRGLLEIAEEYFHWVTAESVSIHAAYNEHPIAPDAIDWPAAKAAPAKPAATLSLGKRAAAVKATGKAVRNSRKP